MRALLQDLHYAIRSLRSTPGFTWIAVCTLALGIATNVVVFSIVNAVMLRALPFQNANQIVILRWQNLNMQPQSEVSASVFFMLREHAQSFENVTAVYPQEVGVNLAGAGAPRYVRALEVSDSFFRTLGAAPALGRLFTYKEDQPGAPGTMVMSHRLWESIFNRDPGVLGRTIKINGNSFTVIGIMPQQFRSYPDADIWIPLRLSAANADPGSDYLVLASLKNGILEQQADRELETLSKTYPLRYLPGTSAESVRLGLERLQDYRTDGFRHNLSILFGAVVLVLLVACANLAALLLVRGLSRTQEIAIRAALGSSRLRLAQIFIVESLVLVLLGGILGVIISKEVLPFVLLHAPPDLSRAGTIQMDRTAVLFGILVSLLTALIIGLVPAARVTSTNLEEMLRQAPRGATPNLRQTRSARLLVSAETGLTVIILGAALLLLQTFLNLQDVAPGFDPQQVWVGQVSLAADRYRTSAATSQLIDQVVEKLKSTPGIEDVAGITGLPLETGLNLPLYPSDAPANIDHAVEYRMVTADYFQTMHVQLVTGRTFASEDHTGGQPVAIINQTLARRWWPHGTAVGHFVRAGEELGPQLTDKPRQIVGVVSDVHESGLALPPPAVVFVPMQQVPDNINAFANKLFFLSIVVRAQKGMNVADEIRAALVSADPDLPLASLRAMPQVVAESLHRPIFYAWFTSAFGLFCLLLTAIGLYGLLSYQVSLRTPEIGVRMALGATRFQTVLLIVRQGAHLSIIGMCLGLVGSLFLDRLLSSMLYNHDHAVLTLLVGEAVLLGAVTMVASLLTAIRVSAIEPMSILRNQ